jgi:protein O-GlcNAc transferase
MRSYLLLRLHERNRLHILSVDNGPVGSWGYPISDGPQHSSANDSANLLHSINGSNVDLTLIDGRFRVACTQKTILERRANANLRIMIHDFWNRPQYPVVLPCLEAQKTIDTMGILKVKDDIDAQPLLTDDEAEKLMPDHSEAGLMTGAR